MERTDMDDDQTTEEAVATETPAADAPAAAPSLQELVSDARASLSEDTAASGGEDYLDFFDDTVETRVEPSSDDETDYESAYRREKAARERAEKRQDVQRLQDKVKTDYKHAYGPTVQGLLRSNMSPSQVERIAQASHNDFLRGRNEALKEYSGKLEAIEKAVQASAETEARAALGGGLPTGQPTTGGGDMTFAQWERAASGLPEKEALALFERVKKPQRY